MAVQADVTHRACVPVVAGSRIERVGASALRVASIVGTHVAVVAVGLNRARSTVSAVADVSKRAGIAVFTRKLVVGCGASCCWVAPIMSARVVIIARKRCPCLARSARATLIGRTCVSVIAFGVVGSEYAIAIHAYLIGTWVSVITGYRRVADALSSLAAITCGAGIAVTARPFRVAMVATTARKTGIECAWITIVAG